MSRPKIEIKLQTFNAAYDGFVALSCENLSLSGNVISLVGHNGAGKSTFMRSILGLLPIASGSLGITFDQGGVQRPLVPEYDMAFCPEAGAVFADITVQSYIELWCRFKHRDVTFYKKEGARYIDLLEVGPLLKKLGRELSKGQRRRVQMTVGFMMAPKLFLLDEPFDGLDVRHSDALADILHEESKDRCFILSSHRLDIIERLSDALIVLEQGKVLSHGPVHDVCRHLSGPTFHISGSTFPEALSDELRERFPSALIQLTGNYVLLAGTQGELQQIQSLIQSIDRNGATVSQVPPSLTDAVSYHLRKRS